MFRIARGFSTIASSHNGAAAAAAAAAAAGGVMGASRRERGLRPSKVSRSRSRSHSRSKQTTSDENVPIKDDLENTALVSFTSGVVSAFSGFMLMIGHSAVTPLGFWILGGSTALSGTVAIKYFKKYGRMEDQMKKLGPPSKEEEEVEEEVVAALNQVDEDINEIFHAFIECFEEFDERIAKLEKKEFGKDYKNDDNYSKKQLEYIASQRRYDGQHATALLRRVPKVLRLLLFVSKGDQGKPLLPSRHREEGRKIPSDRNLSML